MISHLAAATAPGRRTPRVQTHGIWILVFLLGLGARLLYLGRNGPVLGGDSPEYLRLAQNLLEQGVFTLDTVAPYHASTIRDPLYSSFIAAIWAMTGPSLMAIAVVQACLDAFVGSIIVFLARRASDERWAIVAGLFYAIFPGSIHFSSVILSEPLFAFLLTAAVAAIAKGVDDDQMLVTAAGGVILGFAILCRSFAIFMPGVFLLALLAGPLARRRLAHIAVMIACTIATVAPWSIRSSLVDGQLTIVQDRLRGLAMLYLPTRSDLDQRNESVLWPTLHREDPFWRRWQTVKTHSTPEEKAAVRRFGLEEALRNVREHPKRYLLARARAIPQLVLNSFDNFTGINRSFGSLLNDNNLRLIAVKLILLFFFSLIPVALGFVGIGRTRSVAGLLCASAWFSTLAVYTVLWIEYRFWIPVVPCLLANSAAGALRASKWLGTLHARLA